jgi:branched-chain amino acid transport system permease protein
VNGWRGLGARLPPLRAPANRAARIVLIIAAVAFAAAVPLLLPLVTPASGYWMSVLVKIGMAVLLALGLNVVVGMAGLLDLGYVAFFAVGSYTIAILSGAARFSLAQLNRDQDTLSLIPQWHMYYWLFFFVALIVAVLAGLLLGAPTLRLRGDYLAIVTLGFGEIVRITANNAESITVGPWGITQIPHPAIDIGSFHYSFGLHNEPYYWLLLAVITVWLVLLDRLNRSRIGRAWVAIREDEVAAAAMGVRTLRMKLLAFAIGAAVASFSGVIYASQVSYISPDEFTLFNSSFGSITILAMIVVGGMGSIAGPIVGAALIILLPEHFRQLGDARLLIFGLALVAVMILRPQGLIANRRRAAELVGSDARASPQPASPETLR